MIRTLLTERLGIDAPLVGFNRSPAVVAAVSRAGGLGVLAATQYTPEQLDAQLTWIEQQSGGRPFGVDLLVPKDKTAGTPKALADKVFGQIPPEHVRFVEALMEEYRIPPASKKLELSNEDLVANLEGGGIDALLDVAFSHPIALVANALGPPPPRLVERGKAAGVLVAALVGKPDHARHQLAAGVELLIAQGTEAGGHTGTIATMVLTPEVVEVAGDIPVLAAGGIASGRQMAAALALGAAGVWCGSVWLSSVEDITPESIKQKFIPATSSDTIRSATRTGKPARMLRTAWHDAWERPGSPPVLPMPLQPMLVREAWARIDEASAAGHPGARELESFFVGQVVGRFEGLRPAEEIAREIVEDCEARIAQLAAIVNTPG